MQMTFKTLFRSIRQSLGRFVAIFAIVALGVGFFTGIKSANPAMRRTADQYLQQQKLYDFQLLSTLGFPDEDVTAFGDMQGITLAEGGYRADALVHVENGDDNACQLLSLSEHTALPALKEGRMPQSDSECLADSRQFSVDDIGRTLVVSDENADSILDMLNQREFVIVGLAQSPRYLNTDRGSTSIGGGKLSGFLYLRKEVFASEVFHEILLCSDFSASYLTDEYNRSIAALKPQIEEVLTERAATRYDRLYSESRSSLDEAQAELKEAQDTYSQLLAAGTPEEALSDMLSEIQNAEEALREGEEALADFTEPVVYVTDLSQNQGYASFENDIEIIDGIANAFPVFFVLIAALVCMTTMTRMVNDERTQIGTLKALGFSDALISLKYILYAGLASLLGCVCGFLLGTVLLPKIIWAVYSMAYGFAALSYYFSPFMCALVLSVSVIGAVSVTYFACRRELHEKPAELIRPKAPGIGKRILMEHIPFLWNRLSFLNKVMLRNAFRYKKRILMMLLGIGGCTALIVTGFGLKDSVANIMNYQYDDIFHYDAAVKFNSDMEADRISMFLEQASAFDYAFSENLTVQSGASQREATLVAAEEKTLATHFSLHRGQTAIPCPQKGEAVLSSKTAQQLQVSVGDTVWFLQDKQPISCKVSGICDNYIGHYVFLLPESLHHVQNNTIYYQAESESLTQKIAMELRGEKGVSYVAVAADERDAVNQTMTSMNSIVILVIVCAGALAFIVLYNLTNINIMERIREVATVKVLGFRSGETASYVLRENILLSTVGALLGLWLGRLLHGYVMEQVQVDNMMFDVRVSATSYLISFACTVLFALIANLVMRFKLEKVPMAESLKSVE